MFCCPECRTRGIDNPVVRNARTSFWYCSECDKAFHESELRVKREELSQKDRAAGEHDDVPW